MDFYYEDLGNMRVMQNRTFDIAPHLHEHIELAYVTSGSSELYIENKKYDLKAGDFFIVFPNQIHSYANSVDINAIMMIFSPHYIPEFSRVFSAKQPTSPVISNPQKDAVTLAEIMYSQFNGESSPEIIRGLLLSLMGILLKDIPLSDIEKYNVSTLKNILIYCDEHYTEPITIEKAAAELHISRSHLSHLFKERLDTTFWQYIHKRRIEHACELLKKGDSSVTETAGLSGFESVRTFNRVFCGIMGTSPREYKKMPCKV